MSLLTLSDLESETLSRLEETIESGIASFLTTGEALTKIRDKRLYRATHGTFEAYCREKWGMSRVQAHRLITSAEVVEMLPIGNKSAITTESQARELARVEPERRQEVVEKASVATGGKITAVAIRRADLRWKKDDYVMPSRAMSMAQGVVHHLENIPLSDPHRLEAIQYVYDWAAKELSL